MLVFIFHAFSVYYSLYNWIGEHEITKLKKIYVLRIQKKGNQKKAQKDMTVMESQNELFDIFSNVMRKRYLFCTSSHHNIPYEKQQELNKGSGP